MKRYSTKCTCRSIVKHWCRIFFFFWFFSSSFIYFLFFRRLICNCTYRLAFSRKEMEEKHALESGIRPMPSKADFDIAPTQSHLEDFEGYKVTWVECQHVCCLLHVFRQQITWNMWSILWRNSRQASLSLLWESATFKVNIQLSRLILPYANTSYKSW